MRSTQDHAGETTLGLLGRGVEVTGDIIFTDQLQVDGKVTGKLISENGRLIIGRTGRVDAQVEVNVCIIHGVVNGNVSARSRVEVHKGSRVSGDLTTSVLIIEEGAIFNGNIGMAQEGDVRLPEGSRPKDTEEKGKAKGV